MLDERGDERGLFSELEAMSEEELLKLMALHQNVLNTRDNDILGQFVPYDKQLPFFDTSDNTVVFLAGNRSGKTAAGMVFDIKYALGRIPGQRHKPPVTIWVVSPDFTNHVEGVLIPAFFKWCPADALQEFRKSPPHAVFKNGSKIFFKSSDSGVSKFQGAQVDLLHIDEEIEGDVVEECEIRLIDTNGITRVTATPRKGVQWLKDLCKDPETTVIRASMLDNPHIDRKAALKKLDKLPPHIRKTRELGDFMALSGIIYPEVVDPIYWVKPHEYEVDRDANIIMCLDPGYRVTACLWVAVYPDDSLVVFKEYRGLELPPEEHAKRIHEIERHFANRVTKRLIDPASSQHTTNPNSTREQYRELGLSFQYAQNDVRGGIDEVKNYLNIVDNGHPRLKFYDTLNGLREEFENYIWEPPGKSDREMPRKGNDHELDALRYIVFSKPVYESQKKLRQSWIMEQLGLAPDIKII